MPTYLYQHMECNLIIKVSVVGQKKILMIMYATIIHATYHLFTICDELLNFEAVNLKYNLYSCKYIEGLCKEIGKYF
jgi:hypothetical protein